MALLKRVFLVGTDWTGPVAGIGPLTPSVVGWFVFLMTAEVSEWLTLSWTGSSICTHLPRFSTQKRIGSTRIHRIASTGRTLSCYQIQLRNSNRLREVGLGNESRISCDFTRLHQSLTGWCQRFVLSLGDSEWQSEQKKLFKHLTRLIKESWWHFVNAIY